MDVLITTHLKSLLKFNNTHRSKLLKKNVFFSIGLTVVNAFVSFLMYPILIDYLGVDQYGSWLTIASLSTWMTFFEFGLGSGLKNQLAKALSHKNNRLGKELVSTAYFAVSSIVVILFCLLFVFRNTINWGSLLGSSLDSSTLSLFVSIMISSFFIVFIFKLIGNIVSAAQNPYIEKLINTTIQIVLLIVVVSISQFYDSDIVKLSIYWCSSTILIWVVASVLLYLFEYNYICPSIKTIKFTHIKLLLSLGLQFFIIQLSLVVIHGSTNFIISKYIGSEQVVVYNAAYKIFNLANIMYSIIIAPTWVAFVDAIEQNDIAWIRSTVKKMLLIWGGITACMFMILLLSPFIYSIWLGQRITIPFGLSAVLFLYFSTMTFGGIYNMFVNATGKLKTQVVCWLISAVLYLPVVLFLLNHTNLGIYAVVMTLLLSNVYYVLFAPMQYHKFMQSK